MRSIVAWRSWEWESTQSCNESQNASPHLSAAFFSERKIQGGKMSTLSSRSDADLESPAAAGGKTPSTPFETVSCSSPLFGINRSCHCRLHLFAAFPFPTELLGAQLSVGLPPSSRPIVHPLKGLLPSRPNMVERPRVYKYTDTRMWSSWSFVTYGGT